MTTPRRTRPVLRRAHPLRGNGLSGLPSADGNGDGRREPASLTLRMAKAAESAVVEGLRTAREGIRTSETAVFEAVERGVETAYTVIEEYLLRGREAAGRRYQRHTGSNPMSDQPPSQGPWPSPFGPMAPFMEPFVATARMWVEAMSQFTPGGPIASRRWMDQMAAGWAPWWGPANALAPRLYYEVTSTRPAEVSATLDPGAYFDRLTIGELRPAQGEAHPAITDVGITARSGHVSIRVGVPAEQPIGDYAAQIQDESGAIRGRLELTIKTPAGAASADR